MPALLSKSRYTTREDSITECPGRQTLRSRTLEMQVGREPSVTRRVTMRHWTFLPDAIRIFHDTERAETRMGPRQRLGSFGLYFVSSQSSHNLWGEYQHQLRIFSVKNYCHAVHVYQLVNGFARYDSFFWASVTSCSQSGAHHPGHTYSKGQAMHKSACNCVFILIFIVACTGNASTLKPPPANFCDIVQTNKVWLANLEASARCGFNDLGLPNEAYFTEYVLNCRNGGEITETRKLIFEKCK